MSAATEQDRDKRAAAARALEYVRPGMRLGLGTGSTARHFVELLGLRVAKGFETLCVPTSEATRKQAESLGIPLTDLDHIPELDLTVDGADEVDDDLILIKGGGGALLHEKIVARASKRMIVIAEASKHVTRLGAFPLPVEVIPFGFGATKRQVNDAASALGLRGEILLRRRDGAPFVSEGGHWIIDCAFGAIPRPRELAAALAVIPGVVEHGLFIDLASTAILARAGQIQTLGDPERVSP